MSNWTGGSTSGPAGTFLFRGPCLHCTSSDGAATYSSGWTHCFVCEKNYKMEDDTAVATPAPTKGAAEFIENGTCVPLLSRGITQETCEFWGYQVGRTSKDKPVQIANHYVKGKLVAQKLRFPDKTFSVKGSLPGFYGQWLWRDGGKMLVVTEGEIDALSVSQLQGNKWPVVSIPNGAAGAEKTFKSQLEWLEKFEKVILMFDQDEPGQEAAEKCARVLSPGKAWIAHLQLKDANELLKAQRGKEVIDAIWQAKQWRPDGIINGRDMWERLRSRTHHGTAHYPWASLDELTHGCRSGELVVITAGTGTGKSAVCGEVAYHLHEQGAVVGYLALEENVERCADRFLAIHLGRRLHLDEDASNSPEYREAFDATLGTGRFWLYDHWGSQDPEILVDKIRYLAKGLGCTYVILDHLSIVVSGWDTDDERKAIDMTMTKLRSLVEETQIGLIVVSHLKRPGQGAGHENGREVTLSDLRGSHSIAQLADLVIALERDQQDPDKANHTTLRVLKNRFSGDTGLAGTVVYSKTTGRLTADDGEIHFPTQTDEAVPAGAF